MTHPLILMWFIVLGFAMMFLVGWQGHSRYLQATNQAPITTPQLAIGQQILIDGMIDGNYGYGMLWLKSTQWDRFVIKSTTTTINQLSWDVSVQGVISEYFGIIPVVNVYQYRSDQLPSGPKFWYDAVNRVAFRPWYDGAIAASGDLISVVDPIVNKEVIKIRAFECSETLMSPDCSVENDSNLETFISSNRLKFVRAGDLWYVFGDGIGYRIRASDQYYLNTMSQYFDLMNTRLIADLVRGKLKTYCTWPQANVVEYVSHTLREQNGNTFVIIRWLGSNQKLAICQLKMNIADHVISFESITTMPLEE